MFSDHLTKVKSAINEVSKATTELEVYKYLTEILINHLGFNRATVRKVNWERNIISLVCYAGFAEEIPSSKLSLSEELGATGRAALRGEGIVVFDEEEILPELRWQFQFTTIQKATPTHSFAVIPVKAKGRVQAVFEVDRKTTGGRITPQDKEILDLFSEAVGVVLERVFAQEELKAALIRDELTGLFNRRHFMNRLSEEYERAKRYGVSISLCIFDIDNFKLINDTYGHIFGDHVLKQIGRLTSGAVRHVDIAARYGGEEFTVLFTHTTLENAALIAKRIHRAISTLIFPCDEKEIQVTATFGISTYLPANVREAQELLYHADMALYEGKKRYGKNCVVIHTEDGYKILEREEIKFKPFVQTQEVDIEKVGTELKVPHKDIMQKKPLNDFIPFQIILSAISKNLRSVNQLVNELIQSTKIPIFGHWKVLSLHKYNSLAPLTLVLLIMVLFAFYYKKGYKSIHQIHGISMPDNGSNQIGLALIETPPLGDKSKDDTFFKENLTSPKQKIQRMGNKPRASRKERLLARRKIHLQPYSLTAIKGKKGQIIGSEFVLARDDEREKELLAQRLRRAFLLAYY